MTAGAGRRTPPRSVDEALRRSAAHGRNALAEALLAAQALLDATAIGLTGRPASAADATGAANPLASFSARIDRLVARIHSEEAPLPDALSQAILDALEAEITRWETRARDDRDARAVLRAFLGLREILWELGVRGARPASPDDGSDRADGSGRADADAHAPGATHEPARPERTRAARRGRVQRIEVED